MTQGELTTRFAEALGPAAAIAITGGQDAEGRVFACRTDVSRPAGDLITYGPCEGEPPGVYGASIAGVVSIEGRSGGFNLWVNELTPDEPLPWCRAGTSGTVCDADTTVLSDGSTLATQVSGPLEGGGVSYWAMVHRPNGADIELVISNRASPKGMGATLGAEPPLTMEQLVQVVLSPAW